MNIIAAKQANFYLGGRNIATRDLVESSYIGGSAGLVGYPHENKTVKHSDGQVEETVNNNVSFYLFSLEHETNKTTGETKSQVNFELGWNWVC